MKILFTAVGNTDPISMSNEEEGSILHICRKYKPDKIYLYMSKEILEHHKKDNRYILSLEELYKWINKEVEYEIIKREELSDVHIYDYFYKDFREILNDIHEKHPDAKLYLNISSGTPGMKNALFILSNFLNFKTYPIQVGTPIRRANINVDDYDPEAYNLVIQELNNNSDKFVDRTIVPEIKNLNYELKKDIIINHINKYNYSAALTTADSIKDLLPEKSYYLIKAADERIQLKRQTMINYLTKAEEKFELYHDVKRRENEVLIEYILYLDITIKRGLLLEFIRGISPAIFELFVLLFENVYNSDLKNYTKMKNKVRVWDEGKIKKDKLLDSVLSKLYNNRFDFKSYVQTDHLLQLIKNEKIIKETNKSIHSNELYNIIDRLRDVEREARNVAAHEIVSISDDTLKRMTGYNSREVFNDIKQLTNGVGLIIPRNVWRSYDLMNKTIINSFNQD